MARLPRALPVLLACLLLVVAACGEDEGGDERPAATPTPEDTGGEQGTGCAPVADPEPKRDTDLRRPRTRLDSSKRYVATVVTNCGEFEITLAARRAPRTAGSFKYLADQGFYDGTTFHRIVPGFVIQGGDPRGTGTGGPGYSIVEAPPETLRYTRGIVAMAKGELDEAGTSGSQFFVVTGEDVGLPPDYALVGEITAGQEVVDRIGVAPTGPMERPIEPIVIEEISVRTS